MPALLVMLIASAAGPQKLAALGFTRANVEEGVAEVAAEHFARQLALQGFSVTTAKDLAALLGIERQKQLLGCADADSSCLAELTNALGVAAVVTGSLGRFGTKYTVNVKVTDATTGASLAVFSSEVGSEDELPATVSRAASQIADQLRPRGSIPASHKVGLGVGYGAAVVLLGGAALCFGLAATADGRLRSQDPGLDAPAAFELQRAGALRQTVGFVLLGGGVAAALITGIVMMALSERVALTAGPTGVSVRGAF